MDYLNSASQKVEAFIRSSNKFQTACNYAFDQVDTNGRGRVPVTHVALACVYFFRDVSTAVDDFGIKVSEPSADEIRKILEDSGYADNETVSRSEFEKLYVAILKYAAVKCAVGFAQKYGVGMAIGLTSMMIIKRAIRALPGVGPVARPILGFLPSPIFGPLLGILGVFIADRGDLKDVRKKLFPDHGKSQFKAG